MTSTEPGRFLCLHLFLIVATAKAVQLAEFQGAWRRPSCKTYADEHWAATTASRIGKEVGKYSSSVHVGIEQLLDQVDAGNVVMKMDSEGYPKETSHCLTDMLHERDGGEPFQGRENVMWLHLHNFAGTFMCAEATLQGEQCNRGGPNCNWDGDGCSSMGAARVHCNVRRNTSAPYTFSMAERGLDGADFCDGVLKGVMLRDPIAGLTSTLKNNNFNKGDILEMLQTGQERHASHTGCLPEWDTYAHFDNFATRSLSGNAYYSAPRKMTERHLELAKQRLDSFDVVVVLEELRQHLPQLSNILHWDLSRIPAGTKANSHGGGVGDSWTSEELAFLWEVNKYDYMLFEYGKQLAQNITNIAVSLQGSDRGRRSRNA